ncbi:MAG: hypothetical protein R3A44_11355 [Caldilineaceae bacterium]
MKTGIAIIGGGAIGAAVAYFRQLNAPSVSITVVKRDPTDALAFHAPRTRQAPAALFAAGG